MSCRGMNTSVSYCRPNEHAEKAWWTEWQSVFRSINTLLAKKYFWFWRSILCVLVDDNAIGCSGASASAGTLVTTNHLLLLLCWQCAKQSSIRTQMERKYQNLPMHLMFGSFDGSRASWYVAKKNHISSQQTCSVLKSSTVALPVTFRSSEEKLLPSVSAETSWSWHRRHVRPLQN